MMIERAHLLSDEIKNFFTMNFDFKNIMLIIC